MKVGSDHPKGVLLPSSGCAQADSGTDIRDPVRRKSHYEPEGGEESSEIIATSKALGDHGKETKGPYWCQGACIVFSL